MQLINPYQMLGVPDKADIKVCQKAFRKLARELHPDVTKDPEKNKKFILLNNIMDILKDPAKKQQVDNPQPVQQVVQVRYYYSYGTYTSSGTGGGWF